MNSSDLNQGRDTGVGDDGIQPARMPTKTMKAIVQSKYGRAHDVLELRTSTSPRSKTTRCWYAFTRPAWTGASGTS